MSTTVTRCYGESDRFLSSTKKIVKAKSAKVAFVSSVKVDMGKQGKGGKKYP
jgi:hypothetical protein